MQCKCEWGKDLSDLEVGLSVQVRGLHITQTQWITAREGRGERRGREKDELETSCISQSSQPYHVKGAKLDYEHTIAATDLEERKRRSAGKNC